MKRAAVPLLLAILLPRLAMSAEMIAGAASVVDGDHAHTEGDCDKNTGYKRLKDSLAHHAHTEGDCDQRDSYQIRE